ncbi:hypothetical protein ACIGXM_01675 [Kitasatospora sp. NPDC052896]|uniref:hypothetical protein n=1 Tax=Kitasatospora sp. NPDC052896 TaxID=3364061 RepID=UPI0037C9DCED
MKFTKRTGAVLLAVGASAVAGQGAALAATSPTPTQVKAVEDQLATKSVPFQLPVATVTEKALMMPLGGDLNGSLPASPVQPPVPAAQDHHQVMPDQVVRPLRFSQVGPGLDGALPLPAAADGVRPGGLALAAPRSPLNAVGPAVGVGRPLEFVDGADGRLKDGSLSAGDLDPRLIPGAVSVVPGAKATLGGPDRHLTLVDQSRSLLATVDGVAEEAPLDAATSAMPLDSATSALRG